MKTLIKNCNLISVSDKKEKYIENIDILINDNIIEKVEKDIKQEEDYKIINAKGKIVMPGLINTHAHIPMSIFRETVDGYITQDWLTQKIWPVEAKLTEEDVYFASMLSYIEMIYSGTTTINDMYFMQNKIVDAALDTGVRLQVTRTLMDTDGSGERKLVEIEEFIKKYKEKYDTISLNVGIHGLYTNTEEYLQKGLEIAKKYKLPVNMHFCENEQEREDIKKMYNIASPIEPIKKYFKNIHLILAHAVKVTNEEIEKIAKQDIYIAHCPVSNLKLGCGIAPITKMQEENICISLGTDGQGSGSNLDMFETMKYAALLQKGYLENPTLMPAYEVLKMATINGAKTLNLENQIGSIEEGKLADIIILNLDSPLTLPLNDIIAEIVYNVKAQNVETTIVNGKILMENKVFKLKNDPKVIYEKCENIINRIKSELKN